MRTVDTGSSVVFVATYKAYIRWCWRSIVLSYQVPGTDPIPELRRTLGNVPWIAPCAFGLLAWLYRSRFPLFAVLALATAVQACFYTPGASWYLPADAASLILKLAAAIEAWILLTWGIPARERTLLGLLTLAVGLIGVALVVGKIATERWWYNTLRMSVHCVLALGLGTALLYTLLYPPRFFRRIRFHAALLVAWWAGYVAVAAPTPADLEAWERLRAGFQYWTWACLLGWFVLACFEHRKPRL